MEDSPRNDVTVQMVNLGSHVSVRAAPSVHVVCGHVGDPQIYKGRLKGDDNLMLGPRNYFLYSVWIKQNIFSNPSEAALGLTWITQNIMIILVFVMQSMDVQTGSTEEGSSFMPHCPLVVWSGYAGKPPFPTSLNLSEWIKF